MLKTELPVLTDPQGVDIPEGGLTRFWLSLIRDPRDLPFVLTTVKITLTIIPLAVLLYMPFVTGGIWWLLVAALYFFNTLKYKGPFGLMTHCVVHRRLFKQEIDWMNGYLPWVIGPFFGQSPSSYFCHHVGMHHPENNLEDDDSCTMLYQRDSLVDFLKYFKKFFLMGFYNVMRYFNIRKRHKLRNMLAVGELGLFAFWGLMSLVNWQATLVVFVIPFVISRFVMMLGNWTQHAFVDYDDPANYYKNSVTCINVKYNHKCWNDGYHTSHHVRPNLHWTLLPDHLRDNIQEFEKHRALIFENADYLKLWLWLMTKNYDEMANHLINLNGMFASHAEAVALLKSRTKKMPKRGITSESLRDQKIAA